MDVNEIVVAGHICLDITPRIESTDKGLSAILTPGKLINLDGVQFSSGGVVANTGFALHKLGIYVTPMALIGEDPFGDILKRSIKHNTNRDLEQSAGISTSYSIVLAVEGTDRIILHDPAGNNSFCMDHIDFGKVKQSKIFHFGYPPLMRTIYKNGGEELLRIFSEVKQMGVTTSLDMSLPDVDSESGKINWIKIMQSLLSNVDIFLPSIEEAMYIFDFEKYNSIIKKAGSGDFVDYIDIQDVMELGKKIIDFGCGILIIKCGSKGLYARTSSKDRLAGMGAILGINNSIKSDIELFEETYYVDDFKSALAAGDTTIAGFLAGLVRGFDLIQSMKTACMTGATCCAAYDAISTIEDFETVSQKINQNPKKNTWSVLNAAFEYDTERRTWKRRKGK